MAKTVWTSEYFFGNKISDYGIKNGRVDYRTLASAFQAVLNNNIFSATSDIGYWEIENGPDNSDEIEEIEEKIEELEEKIENLELDEDEDNEDEISDLRSEIEELEDEKAELEDESDPYNRDIFQWYIIDDNGAGILKDYTDEIVFYNSELDMYLWGVTHYGTSWDYVLTDIEIELDNKEV